MRGGRVSTCRLDLSSGIQLSNPTYIMHLYIWCVDPMLWYEVYLSVLYLSNQPFGNLLT
jgi:hypothetical protein